MTEQEWLDGIEPEKLLTFLKRRRKVSNRKLRLFAVTAVGAPGTLDHCRGSGSHVRGC